METPWTRREGRTTYDDLAHRYDDEWTPHVLDVERRLTDALDLRRGDRVLDLACGTGVHSVAMLERTTPGELVAVDGSVEMLRAAVARAEAAGLVLTTRRADLVEALETAPDASFDVVSLRFALAYFDWRRWLPRVASILRPTGRVGVLTNLETSTPQARAVYQELAREFGLPDAAPNTPRSAEELRDVLSRAGLGETASFCERRRLFFRSGHEVARWLLETGYVAHPSLSDAEPEAVRWLAGEFAQRIEAYRTDDGIPLDLEIVGMVAARGGDAIRT